jgi:hypothetical protein
MRNSCLLKHVIERKIEKYKERSDEKTKKMK